VTDDPAERPHPIGSSRLLSVDLRVERSFVLTVRSGRNGYYDAQADDGLWEWEPASYVTLGFEIDKLSIDEGTKNILVVVARLLAFGLEDAALVLNSDRLVLARLDGVLRKHGRTRWWTSYGEFANEIIPD